MKLKNRNWYCEHLEKSTYTVYRRTGKDTRGVSIMAGNKNNLGTITKWTRGYVWEDKAGNISKPFSRMFCCLEDFANSVESRSISNACKRLTPLA